MLPLVMSPVTIFATMCLIMRHIDIIVPLIFHEIDRSVTGVVLTAMLAPFFLMTGSYVQADWLINNTGRRPSNHDGVCVNDFRLRCVSDVNAAIKPGWPTLMETPTSAAWAEAAKMIITKVHRNCFMLRFLKRNRKIIGREYVGARDSRFTSAPPSLK